MARVGIVGLRFAAAAFVLAAATIPAAAQDISVTFGSGTGLTERVLQLVALVTVLSLAPSILIMVTSFTRIVVVLSLLRTALGTATAPPNAVIISLAPCEVGGFLSLIIDRSNSLSLPDQFAHTCRSCCVWARGQRSCVVHHVHSPASQLRRRVLRDHR